MLILRDIAALKKWREKICTEDLRTSRERSIGFVPTMGALHAGHLSLMKQAGDTCDLVVASIFVNPLQFGPNEDLARYPRPFERDCELLEQADVDVLFAPTHSEFYDANHSTYVVEETVGLPLCGESRPGHFRGVTTVVLKLFNLIGPTHAFFGQKDAQQCAVIERMVRDLAVPVRIVRGAIVRESDGLALSSRNIYLSPEERSVAPRIYASLQQVQEAYTAGVWTGSDLEAVGRDYLAAESAFRIQYYELRDPVTLLRILDTSKLEPGASPLIAVAAYLGKTRLIDNLVLTPPVGEGELDEDDDGDEIAQ